ncbi:MAG: MMPL family transporter [Desulfobacterales bacterium]|jgi:predicted RND superfamily exporter protein|nr:MMPL family transporter [Desulfobacterales bacterium]
MVAKDNAKAILKPTDEEASLLETIVFKNRMALLVVFILATCFFGYKATGLHLDANFEKMIPTKHPYIVNYFAHKEDLKGFGNTVRIAVETTQGDIYTREFLDVLRKVTDEIFFIPGVERSAIESLWTPNTRWIEVTEQGFEGGAVIPDTYDGSPARIELLKANVLKARIVGRLVANDLKSAVVNVPLMEINPDTGKPLSYKEFSGKLETLVRDKYQSDTIKIHIVGFAKVMGDMLDATGKIVLFFGLAVLITLIILLGYTRCIRSTLLLIFCSVTAAVWQMGMLSVLQLGLNPYSMLVPFLVFAIGVSHGVQVISAMHREAAHGVDKLLVVKRAFRQVYIPGLTALITDGFGFAVLAVIQIPAIQQLAAGASIGVIILIITNLTMLPILMSYAGVRKAPAGHTPPAADEKQNSIWATFAKMTRPTVSKVAVLVAAGLFAFGIIGSKDLKIGDLDPGAPELRPNSRYNLDNLFMVQNYSASSDIFVLMVTTPPEKNSDYGNLVAMEDLQWRLDQLPGVQSTSSVVDAVKALLIGYNEGNLKWRGLPRNQQTLNASAIKVPTSASNREGTLSPVVIYLKDHKAETLQAVVDLVEDFAAKNNTEISKFLMAAGGSGIEAATNIVIGKAQYTMLFLVYLTTIGLVALTFRRVGAVIAIIIPLMLTSALCQLVMVRMGIGVKVATLPVISLGVGVGVDYGVYIYAKMRQYLQAGMPLFVAYGHAMRETGKPVILIGLMLAIGVATWAFSPIKFQADMGLLLTFMFIVNMVGAILLLPALTGLMESFRGLFTGKREQPLDVRAVN